MLSHLHIENIAVIESADIEFHEGFNVLTGETGAGKSIIIDAIGAILGERTSREVIRTGSGSAHVSAVFTGLADLGWLRELGVEIEPGEPLLLQRDIYADGKNNCRVNGRPFTVSLLRQIGDRLITIHGQHDSRQLFDESTHLGCLDSFASLAGPLGEYLEKYNSFLETKSAIKRLTIDESEKLRQIENLRFQIDELSSAGLKPGEEEELDERRSILRNAETISEAVERACMALSGDDDFEGAVSLIQQAQGALERASGLSSELEKLGEGLMELTYHAEDLAERVRDFRDTLSFSDEELDQLESRLDELYKLKRKYGPDVEQMLAYLDKIQLELDEIELSEEKITELEELAARQSEEAMKLAEKLSNKRRLAADELSKRLHSELSQLDMEKVRFQVEFQRKTELSPEGLDESRFLMSANPGEDLKPISKIASGGELARIMLAIKNVLAEKDSVPTLIFDEVDTGVSGRAAQKVGEKLAKVAALKQVLCVTHLPQLAALASHHFCIEKSESRGRTFTTVRLLDFEGRKKELARIIGGANITETTLKSAGEMIKPGL